MEQKELGVVMSHYAKGSMWTKNFLGVARALLYRKYFIKHDGPQNGNY